MAGDFSESRPVESDRGNPQEIDGCSLQSSDREQSTGTEYDRRTRWLTRACLGLLSVVILFVRVDQGWIPHDEGLLGQSAVRTMQGEYPHIDFDDAYTGGLALFHGLVFESLGTDLYHLRVVLLGFALLFVLTVFSIATRFVSAPMAALIALTCLVWSVPNYFAPMPSWYNLFFATFGTWALIRFVESGRYGWIAFAGVMGGLSILVKISGLFYVAAAGLFFVYHEQSVAERTSEKQPKGLLAFAIILLLEVFLLALLFLVREKYSLSVFLHFLIPGTALAFVLILREAWLNPVSQSVRLRKLLGLIAVFMTGCLFPILVFSLRFLTSGSLEQLIEGVFVLPQQRIDSAAYPLPPITTIWAAIPFLLLLIVPSKPTSVFYQLVCATSVLGLLLCLLWGGDDFVYELVWNSLRPSVPILSLVVLIRVVSHQQIESDRHSQKVFLLISMAAMLSLIQFPYSFGIYFCYCAPIVILAYVAFLSYSFQAQTRLLHISVCVFFLFFGLMWMNPGYIRTIGVKYGYVQHETVLDPERARLRVTEKEARMYQDLVETIQAHSSVGDYLYATPDCPEIYYLSDRRNPTPTFYEILAPKIDASELVRNKEILEMLDEHQVSVVVLNWKGEFSGKPRESLKSALREKYHGSKDFYLDPEFVQRQPTFTVMWQDRSSE